ncbi:MAG TPA: OmpH family outer membrane protein [Fimbriimonadaceae bacterium]|nr:OmpH family outer membrane protein [Fimbriimonadaceae bacterium]
MNTNGFQKMGWVVAAALAGIMLGSGFQGSAEKTGIVDLSRIVEQSDFGKQNQTTFNSMKAAREGLLEFIDQYRILTNEQAQRLKDLMLKDKATPQDQAEIDRIKGEVTLADKRSKEMSTKTNLTPEERTLMSEYATRSQNMEATAQRWFREFTTDLQAWADKQKLSSVERARAAIQEVAKAQGFTIVFEVGVAPYGANDLSDAALKAMNAKK